MSVMNVVASLHRRARSRFDVATEMDKVVGSLNAITLRGQDVLVGVFLRPSQTYVIKPGGELLMKADGVTPVEMFTAGTGKELVEDVYQGKVVRILKMGPQAFSTKQFPELLDEWPEGRVPKVGDWVFCRANDGLQLSVQGDGAQKTDMFDGAEKLPSNGGWPCRIVAFGDIVGLVDDPYAVV